MKWNVRGLRRSSNQTVWETVSRNHCCEVLNSEHVVQHGSLQC